MTAIADHAGVAERTLYNLFGSKAGLMLATLRDRDWWRRRVPNGRPRAHEDP